MNAFSIASFNTLNLIGPDQEFYPFQSYTPEDHAGKIDWLGRQLARMDADIVGFQEIFSKDALRDGIDLARRDEAYDPAHLVYAPNLESVEAPGKRRPGVALLSRFPVVDVQVIQDLDPPMEIAFPALAAGAGDGGSYRLRRVSRPIQKVRIDVNGTVITIFNCHLKSKLGAYLPQHGAAWPTETDLTAYDPLGRAIGAARSTVRRLAEALVLRRAILAELDAGFPVIAVGDFNDVARAVSSQIISGEVPSKRYAGRLRHDAASENDRYTSDEEADIQGAMGDVQLQAAATLHARRSNGTIPHTTAFEGVTESIDQIYLSRHFHPDRSDRIGELTDFTVLNNHLNPPDDQRNPLASDHGQIIAHLRLL